jgi:hypothetical protein
LSFFPARILLGVIQAKVCEGEMTYLIKMLVESRFLQRERGGICVGRIK